MSDLAVSVQHSQPAPTEPTSRKPGVTGKVRRAVDLMVRHGLKRDEAAQQAGLKDNSLYVAFRRPEVLRYYRAECDALRTSLQARGIHAMSSTIDQTDNLTARVAAYKALHLIPDESDVSRGRAGIAQTPGFLITIINQAAAPVTELPRMSTIEAKATELPDQGSAER